MIIIVWRKYNYYQFWNKILWNSIGTVAMIIIKIIVITGLTCSWYLAIKSQISFPLINVITLDSFYCFICKREVLIKIPNYAFGLSIASLNLSIYGADILLSYFLTLVVLKSSERI